MEKFGIQERICENAFCQMGECYHLWTPENFEIIFTNEADFKLGMSIIGICAKLFPDIKILTFELMTNHLHVTAVGYHDRIVAMFSTIKEMLKRCFKSQGRVIDWDGFKEKLRPLTSLTDARNVISYDNRNGYVVSDRYTPFSYPWGANRYYFNPDACRLAREHSSSMSLRQLRKISHSRFADGIKDLITFDGYALPLSFCDISSGEELFRGPTHYFNSIAKNIESNAAIAKEVGESIFYTDDELFGIISRFGSQKFSEPMPSRLNNQAKIEVAKIMRYDYNASDKQIQRMLKIEPSIINTLFKHN